MVMLLHKDSCQLGEWKLWMKARKKKKNRGIEEVKSSSTGHTSHRLTASVHSARI